MPKRLLVLAFVALTVLAACAGSQRPKKIRVIRPPYTPEAAAVFDDVLAPAIFGFDPEGRIPATDPKLRLRTRTAEFVLPAKVETLSRVGGAAHSGSYEVTLVPTGGPLIGQAVAGPVVLTISAASPSYAWLQGAGPSFVGTRLLLFGRYFQQGEALALHFRAEPDTRDVRAVVARDAGLRVLR